MEVNINSLMLSALFTIWVFALISLINYLQLKFYDKTSYQVNGRTFSYKGFEVHVKVDHKTIHTGCSDFPDFVSKVDIYYVNEKPVACMYKLNGVLHTTRRIDFNSQYDSSDFYKILKMARKNFWNEIKEKNNLEKEKIYD